MEAKIISKILAVPDKGITATTERALYVFDVADRKIPVWTHLCTWHPIENIIL